MKPGSTLPTCHQPPLQALAGQLNGNPRLAVERIHEVIYVKNQARAIYSNSPTERMNRWCFAIVPRPFCHTRPQALGGQACASFWLPHPARRIVGAHFTPTVGDRRQQEGGGGGSGQGLLWGPRERWPCGAGRAWWCGQGSREGDRSMGGWAAFMSPTYFPLCTSKEPGMR